ncbi:ABC transporter substrate-binding protein [Falsiroseomonas sp.]|uniref:ABC transporter substrate-binding protein n=1 Tax=Falsiroseomonas sp. TaxID=2870721 RepID=UPI003F72F842
MTLLRIAAEKCRFTPPRQVTDDTSVLTLKNLVLEPLIRWDDVVLRPGLFGTWAHDGTARRWRFTIRPGARFHDGKPCVAEDVVEFIGQICNSLDMFGMKWAYSRYLAQARITAEGSDVVAVENPTPFADILDIFTEFYLCRLTPDGRPLLGTGPWRVLDHMPERDALLERVAAPADRIAFTAIPDADDRLRALRDGSADAAMNVERMHAAPDFSDDLAWGRALNTLSVMYYLNCAQGFFTSEAARRAVNMAVDSQAIIDGLFHGLGQRSSTIVSPLHLGMKAAALSPIPHDRDAARRLLDGAVPSSPLLIRTPEHMPEKAREISERVAADLAAIGLPTRIEVQKDRPEFAREVGRKEMGDMAIFDSTPHSTYRVLNDKVSSAVKGIWWQGHDDQALEAMITAANHAVTEPDREAAYGHCLSRLQANPPWLYLFHPIEVFAHRKDLGGITLDGKGVLGIA